MVRRRTVLAVLGTAATAGCSAQTLNAFGPSATPSLPECDANAPWPTFQGGPSRRGRSAVSFDGRPSVELAAAEAFPRGRVGRTVCTDEHAFVAWDDDATVFRYHFGTGAVDSLELDRPTRVYPAVRCSTLVVAAKGARYRVDAPDLTVVDERSTASPYTGPLFDGERLYVPSGRGLEALAPDGEPRWTYDHRRLLTGLAATDDAVYAVESNADGGRLTALDPANGEPRWHASVGETYADPVVGRNVYATNAAGRVIALDPADGTVRWTHDAGTVDARFGVPAVGDGRVFVPDEGTGTVRALDSDTGTTHWETPIRRRNERESRTTTLFAPVVTDGSVLVPGGPAGVTALSRATGDRLWQVTTDPVVSPLAATTEAVYAATPSGVLALRPAE